MRKKSSIASSKSIRTAAYQNLNHSMIFCHIGIVKRRHRKVSQLINIGPILKKPQDILGISLPSSNVNWILPDDIHLVYIR